jgi:zinc/manganese transport system ATP-binding protein
MDRREDRSILAGVTKGAYAEAVRRIARDRLAVGIDRGRGALQRYFDGGFAPGTERTAASGILVSDLTLSYQATPVIEGVTVEFPRLSMTAVIGPNGAGKSTLLKAIAGVLRPRSGHIDYEGGSPREIAYLPQSDEIDRSFPISVGEFVALGHWRGFGAFRPAADGTVAEMRHALDTVGLAAVAEQPIAALSVGQFRRALFARLMLQRARTLLLDEPFAAVDMTTTADLLRLIERWHSEGCTVIAVLHDLDQVRAHFPRAVLLARRCIASGETATVLTQQNLSRAGYNFGGENAQ